MAAPGRGAGRGESKNVQVVDEADPRIEGDRRAQLEAASIMGIAAGDIPVRGRGGFRSAELRTIPENVTSTRVEDLGGSRQVEVLANFVPINPMPNRVVQMYRVDFEPKVESQQLMRFLFKTAATRLFTRLPIYDGAHECRSGQNLPQNVTSVTIADPQADDKEYTVKFTNTGTSSFGAESLRIYNMHMKSFLRMMGFYSPQVGIYVHPDHNTPINEEIMMMRGYNTAANLHDQNRMLMNLEATHKLVQRNNVLVFMQAIKSRARGGNLQEILRQELVGKIVVTSYNQRVYRVEDIDFSVNPNSTFDRKGQPTSYINYYREVHNKQILDVRQPLLKGKPNNKRVGEDSEQTINLVPELCNIAGLTEQQRTDNRLRFDLIRASQVPPADRVTHMRQFLRQFHSNRDIREQLSDWGYSYGTEALRMTAHIVPMTGFAYGDTCRQPLTNYLKPDQNSANFEPRGIAVVPQIRKMVIITTRIDLQSKNQIAGLLRQGFDKINLKVDSVEMIDINEGDAPQHYINNLRRIAPDTTLAIIIMHNQNKERYDAIKKAASVEKGLITQVVTAKLMTDQKKARSAATKIAIQIAAKVGGEPWWVDIPMKKTMICGYDTYHDTAQRGRSFGAFVASINMRFSRWWSKADAHDRLDEISGQIAANISNAIQVYKKFNNGEYPERVIIYRDGVGEGQIQHVYEIELKRIQEALEALPDVPKLTMIIVNKRIGARFYMRSGGESFSNPPPGTVIDHTVTRENRFDFYLVSQSTRQGTVTPTYYNIIFDQNGFSPDIHQRMAFKMCLMYYNWTGTVRVPAPCQYAHKLALLCGEHLHAQPNSQLDDRLHFL